MSEPMPTDPAAEPTAEPTAGTAAKPTAKPAAEPAAEPTAGTAAEPAAEPVPAAEALAAVAAAPARRLVVKVTCGPEDAERSNQGLTVAATAVLAGADVSLWLTGEATWYAVAGREVDLGLAGAAPATELVDVVLAAAGAGGRVVACTQCAARRGIVEGDLREGAVIAGAAGFVEEVLAEGVQALVY